MSQGKLQLLLLTLVGVSIVLGSERKTRALPFPDASTVGVSKQDFFKFKYIYEIFIHF